MQKAIKKVYLSILVTVLCLFTLTATTFAWVGIFTNSTLSDFELNLKTSDLQEYGIEISLTGEEGSFGTTIETIDVKREILRNNGSYNMDLLTSEEAIEKAFSTYKMTQCSTQVLWNNQFSNFLDVNNATTKGYFKFDIYISANRSYESDAASDYHLDAYLTGDLLEGNIGRGTMINEFIYPSEFINPLPNGIQAGTRIREDVKSDSSHACRVGIQKYNVVEKGKPEAYDVDSRVNGYIIYQDGSQYPVYDPETGIYDFGGILEEKYNFALKQYNKMYSGKILPAWALNRNDTQYDVDGINQIIDSSKDEEKIGINDMMKLTFYFWFEGWDADCHELIDRRAVTLNLNFANYVS